MLGKTPLDFFNLFIDDDVKHIIFTESNRFAKQQITKDEHHLLEHPHARGHDWKKNPLTFDEINPFLAVIITMGVIGLPNIR